MVEYKYDAWGNHEIEIESETYEDLATKNPFRYRGYYYDQDTRLYYLKSRYYDPVVGRFITIDDISYIDPETINGLNLYAYCGNNPVMGFDPDGTWDWGKFWRLLGVAAISIAVVAGVALLTVATGGALAPVLISAGIGAASSGIISAVTQYATTGTVDIGQLLVEMFTGAVMGAFGGSALGIVGMAVAGGVTGFAGSIASDFVAGESINWGAAIASGVFGAVFGAASGGGAQYGKNATVKALMQKVQTNAVRKQIKNQVKLLSQRAIKALKPSLETFAEYVLQYVVYSVLNAYSSLRRA